MLDNLSISKRIWGGYATMVLLLVGIASFGYYAVSSLGQSLREYRQTSAQTVLANEYIEDLFQARIGSLKFRVNQSDASAAEVHENIAGITNDERLQETFENSPELKSEILALKGDAGSYAEAFGRLVEFQRQIERLNEQLAEVGLSTRMMLTEIMETAFADGDIEAAFYAGVAQQELMLGRLYMERFLRDNDPASFALVGQYLSSTADQMTILLDNLENLQRRNLANNVISNEILFLDLAADVQTAITRRNAINDNELDRIGPDVQARFGNVIDTSIAQQTTLGPEGQKFADRIVWLKPIVGVLAALAGLILAQVIGSSISRAVKDLANRTEKLATGDMSVDIKGAEHQHEIGQMARALGIFRDAELDRRNQAAREEQRTKEITKVVGLLSDALSQLAKGDLTVRMPENQSEEFRSLCANFNHSATQLQSIMSDVVEASGEIAAGTNNLASGSEQLAVRTERQASALAETTATITQIGSEIDDTAKKSKDTQALVQIAGSKAEKGREVVTKSVAAMDKIRKGSEEISKITSVIDDLAFQTNLLALNAGVEAARAGEEGRGFAVVAAEVRVLAQHAGEAAQRINQQITSSVKEVTEGASLADETSQALSEIAEMVETVNDAVSKISETAQNQAVGVKEINIAMTELDSLTQQNAAMVEETTAATMELKNEVTTLQTSAAILKLDGNTQFSSSVFDSETSADASWEAQLQAERDLATIAAQ